MSKILPRQFAEIFFHFIFNTDTMLTATTSASTPPAGVEPTQPSESTISLR